MAAHVHLFTEPEELLFLLGWGTPTTGIARSHLSHTHPPKPNTDTRTAPAHEGGLEGDEGGVGGRLGLRVGGRLVLIHTHTNQIQTRAQHTHRSGGWLASVTLHVHTHVPAVCGGGGRGRVRAGVSVRR